MLGLRDMKDFVHIRLTLFPINIVKHKICRSTEYCESCCQHQHFVQVGTIYVSCKRNENIWRKDTLPGQEKDADTPKDN